MAFRRALGTFDSTMLVVGGIIGAGIFINPSLVAQRLSSGALVLAAWIAGGVIALAGALAFAELAALYPSAGGQYVYLREAYHPLVAFLFGWASLLLIQGGGIAAVAITFAEYATRLAGARTVSPRLLAVGSLAALALVNVLGVKPGSRLLNVLVVLKIAALGVLIAGGLWLSGGSPAPAAPAAAAPPGGGRGLLAFGAALVPILFSYGGWQNVNVVAEEVRDPRRTLPRALLIGSVTVMVVYVLANVVYLAALGHSGLAGTATPAADAVRKLFGPGADRLISAAIAVSTFGFLDLTLLAPTRITYAMARDGLLPASLARLDSRFGTPVLAILLQAGWGILLVLTGTYGGLVDSVVFADWIFFGATVIALLILRPRARHAPPDPAPGRASGFRTPGYPVLPILFAAAALLVVVSAVRSNPSRAAWGCLLLGTGVPVYFFFASRRSHRGEA